MSPLDLTDAFYSGRRRKLFLMKLRSAAEDPDTVEGSAASWCSTLIQTLPLYNDRASRRAVLGVLRTALRNETFLKTFTAMLVRTDGSKVSRQDSCTLFMWSCAVLQELQLPAALKAAQKIMECQITFLNALVWTRTPCKSTVRALHGVLYGSHIRGKDVFKDMYYKLAVSTGSPGLVKVILEHMEWWNRHQAMMGQDGAPEEHHIFLPVLIDQVVNAREPVPAAIVECYRPLISGMSPEAFEGILMPALLRAVKRLPEAVLPTAVMIFGMMTVLDQQADTLMKDLVQQFRHPKDAVRGSAYACLRTVATKVGETEALAAMVAVAEGLLTGTAEGKLRSAQDRAGIVSAVTALGAAPSKSPARKELSANVTILLCKFYGEEVNEGVKLEIVRALGVWSKSLDSLPTKVVEQYTRGLKEKEALQKAHLHAIVQVMLGSTEVRSSAVGLLAPLVKVASDGSAKAAQRAEGVAAALAVSLIASANVTADKALEPFWAVLRAPNAALLSTAMLSKLPVEEAAYAAQLAEVLLLQHGNCMGKEASRSCARLLVAAMLHYEPVVRKVALKSAIGCVGENPSLAGAFILALQEFLANAPSYPTPVVPATASTDDAGVSQTALSERFQHALRAIAPQQRNGPSILQPEVAARFLLAAHHPVMVHASCPFWPALRRRLGSIAGSLGTAEAVRVLMGAAGAESSSAAERHAAHQALGSAMNENAQGVYSHLMTHLADLLVRSEHDALSPSQILIFNTPPGEIAIKVDINQLSISDAGVQTATAPKTSAAMGARAAPHSSMNGSAASGGRSKPTAQGKGNASKIAEKKDPAQLKREKQLAEEAEVREEVRAVQRRLERGLDVLAGAALGNRPFTADHLEQFLELVLPLLGSPLVGEGAAFEAVHALACSLPGSLGTHGLAVARALRLVELDKHGDVSEPELVKRDPIAESISALSSAVSAGSPLPTPAYIMLFPILAAVLSWPQWTPLHEEALSAVALHVSPGGPLPRKATLGLLYHVLQTLPSFRGKVQPLLDDLCRGIEPGDLAAALQGLLASSADVRAAALAALPHVECLASGHCTAESGAETTLYIACHDVDEANAQAARELMAASKLDLPSNFVGPIVAALTHRYPDIRTAAAAALSAGIQSYPQASGEAVQQIIAIYSEGGSQYARSGCALGLKACAAQLNNQQVPVALDFLLGQGLADVVDDVRGQMVAAGMAIVTAHGAEYTSKMLQLFEGYLEAQDVADEESYDRVREGVVVFLGTLAQHLDPAGRKVRSILDTLVDVLRTPSSSVQQAVSDCLVPLMAGLAADQAHVHGLINKVLNLLTKGESYGDRRGAAYGLAGIVKGLGVSAIKGFGIMDALRSALDDQSSADAREGALFAFELLCTKLGRLFEPYLVQLMGKLLERFGDVSASVRHATSNVARGIMSNLSSQGVKLVMPLLLDGVDSRTWRSKQGSVQMLGAMAYCAPKQLGTALPSIVPKLSEALTDPHPKVQAAARTALKEVGSVIRNAEVQELVPALLAAIADPNTKAKPALDTLLTTEFVNAVDAASLALIVPVVHRGLRDRSGDVKKKAARIVGNMCVLINEPKDMAPYVPLLMPELQSALVDPLPEVRATAAKALGSLLKGMGEQHFQGLMPWLLATLKSEKSSVERSGAAQGMAEVLAVLGRDHIEALLPDVLAACTSPSPFVREGNLTLFRFLPHAIPDQFQEHLDDVLPAILDGLADESEGVRDAALSAGRTAVELFAQTSLPLLLPAVEAGIINDNWRIRQSSVELLGDLLFKVAGTSGKVHMDGDSDDEGLSSEAHGNAIIEALGWERRNEIVASLYMARSDVAYTVRSAALHVWKTIVSNTPRTLAEILPALMKSIISALASPGEEQQQMAGRCLGELVRKMGDRVLGHIIPILQQGMAAEGASTRQGVCYGLKELLDNISRQQLAEHLSALLPTVQAALVDSHPGVRQAAGSAFNILFKGGAGSAVDSVIPALLAGLDGEPKQAAQALEGLRVILGVRPQTLSSMVPKLLKPPLHSTALRAIGSLAEVAGPSIHPHLATILPPVLSLASGQSRDEDAAKQAVQQVSGAVGEDGAYLLIAQLEKALEEPTRRRAAAETIAQFCSTSKHDFQEHVPSLLTSLVGLMMEEDHDTLVACWTALGAVIASIPKELQPSYVRCMREAVQTARDKERRKRRPGPLLLGGFCLPKALQPVLPIYLQGVLQGSSAELRELAAEALGELVDVTSQEALRPFTVQITGPLIRIIGDRFAWQVKAAILHTLGLLIAKAGPGLKPFIPQLQTTFLKCLGDQARQVRQSAAENLGQLTKMSTRVDQLAADLTNNAKVAEPALAEAYLTALRGMLLSVGERISPAVLSNTGAALQELMASAGDDEMLRGALAACLGVFVKHSSAEEVRQVLLKGPLGPPAPSKWDRLGHSLLLAAVAANAPERLEEVELTSKAVAAVTKFSRDEGHAVRLASARAAGHLVLAELRGQLPHDAALVPLVPVMVALVGVDQSSDVQRQMLLVMRKIAVENSSALLPHYTSLIPSIISLLQQTQGPTKLAGDRTLGRVLQIDQGLGKVHTFISTPGAGTTAKAYLTEACLRRLSRLPLADEDDDETLL